MTALVLLAGLFCAAPSMEPLTVDCRDLSPYYWPGLPPARRAEVYRYPVCDGQYGLVETTVHDLLGQPDRTTVTAAIFGPAGLPTAGASAVVGDRYFFEMDWGQVSVAVLHRAPTPNGRLVIHHSGHGQWLQTPETRAVIDALLTAGFDVLAYAMPGYGENTAPAWLWGHDVGWQFPGSSYVRYFLEPVIRGVNHLGGSYCDVSMIGLSGGGWATHLVAALDERVTRSYPVAGSVPWFLVARNPQRNLGDFEQIAPYLHAANYEQLFVLAVTGGRRQLQVLNRYDSCCFAEDGVEYAAALSWEAARYGGSWELWVDYTHQRHQVSPAALEVILEDLGP